MLGCVVGFSKVRVCCCRNFFCWLREKKKFYAHSCCVESPIKKKKKLFRAVQSKVCRWKAKEKELGRVLEKIKFLSSPRPPPSQLQRSFKRIAKGQKKTLLKYLGSLGWRNFLLFGRRDCGSSCVSVSTVELSESDVFISRSTCPKNLILCFLVQISF